MSAALSVSPLACWLIGLYQRHVSPHKGFSCAYRVVRRRESCSAYAKRVIARFGVALGGLLLRRRFRRCHEAAAAGTAVVTSRPVRNYEPKQQKRKESSRTSACDNADCGGCGDIPTGGADLLSACPADGIGCCDGF